MSGEFGMMNVDSVCSADFMNSLVPMLLRGNEEVGCAHR